MNSLLASVIIIIAGVFCVYFYYKAAGSLNPGKLNLISLTGAMFFLQTFIGIALIVLGYDKHYTLKRLIDRESSISTTFLVIMVVAVVFPLAIHLALRAFRIDARKDYSAYLKKKTEYYDSRLLFWLVVGMGILCLALLALLLKKIGYLPLAKMFVREETFEMALERARNAKIIVVNQYVTNIMVHLAIPVLAYFTFACALASKKLKWWILAGIFLLASLITKTYNFAKTPVVFFLVAYVFILIYHLGGIKKSWVLLVCAAGLAFLVAAYAAFGINLDMTDIYNGIWGRTFFTQVGTLSYNFDLFPSCLGFLGGRSFSQFILPLFGFDGGDHIRSARVLMEVYGSEGVYEGSAGVMNSLFVGEAYANFGWVGLVLSVLWVAFVIALIFFLALKQRKTPATVALFAYFTVNMASATQGGFVEFVYNLSWVVVFAALMLCQYLFVRKGRNLPEASEDLEEL